MLAPVAVGCLARNQNSNTRLHHSSVELTLVLMLLLVALAHLQTSDHELVVLVEGALIQFVERYGALHA